jgi:site-specific DNA-methyltransferase (adenine-specific)
MINIYNEDSLQAMRKMDTDQYDLAIVDPPYFSDYGKQNYTGSSTCKKGIPRQTKKIKHWKVPGKEYFLELERISKNTIIWGCNYYAKYITSPGRVVWFKKNLTSTFSKCEIASHSFGLRVDYFEYLWNGMLQENMKHKEKRIHPTQKPVVLYKWILQTYAKTGDKILDTHLGSGSIAVACHDMGFSLDGYELDTEYYEAACKRLKEHQRQLKLF